MKTILRALLAVMVLAAARLSGARAGTRGAAAGVRPEAYDLHLIPDAEHLTFKGEVKITVDVAESHRHGAFP